MCPNTVEEGLIQPGKSKESEVKTAVTETLLSLRHRSLQLSFLDPPGTARPGKKPQKTPLKRSIVVARSYSLEFLSPHSCVTAGFLRLSTLLKLGEPTEAMRLPQLSTCHPPLLDTRSQRGGESSCSAVFNKLHRFQCFVSTLTSGWMYFSHRYLPSPAQPHC